MRTFLRYWLPVLLMLGAISLFSTEIFTAKNTLSVLRALFGVEDDDDSDDADESLQDANFYIRKTAHVTEYAVLAALVYFAIRRGREDYWRWTWALVALAFAAGTALLDEWHQSFEPGRTASTSDVMLDTMGGVLALGLILVYSRLRAR